ncbi:MAG: anti-sigma factor [Blastocatellales bacterium]
MECRAVLNSLSDYLDGQNVWMPDDEAKQIESHLTNCPACQNFKLELNEIKTAARELPLHTPPRAMWTRIANVIEEEITAENGRVRRAQSASGWWGWLRSRRFTFSLPQLGAGALAVALIVAAISGIFGAHSGTLNLAGVQTALLPEEDEIKADLERRLNTVNARKARWDSQRRAEFEQHMTRVDESLKRCRYMLGDNPKDPVHQQMVRALYNEKRQLLEDVERLRW